MMASTGFLHQPRVVATPLTQQSPPTPNLLNHSCGFPEGKRKATAVVSAVGELSSGSTTYLIAGAAAIALVGTAFPILFSRKDTCPECDGAGFVRKSAGVLNANAARKDLPQIVCKRCNGLGKLNQIDK